MFILFIIFASVFRAQKRQHIVIYKQRFYGRHFIALSLYDSQITKM